jgi:hypothetical protein
MAARRRNLMASGEISFGRHFEINTWHGCAATWMLSTDVSGKKTLDFYLKT